MLAKSQIAVFCILGMVAGFLVSRVVLSISMFLFGINAIRDVPPRQWLQQRWWLIGMGWVAVYALSWFWSDDKASWGDHLQTKLPFLLLPLAFSFQPRFTPRQFQVLTVSFAVMLMAGACYSVSFFIRDPEYYLKEYHISHLLPTLPKKDHIRTSLATALFIIWCVYAWPFIKGMAVKWITGISIAVLIIFIHVLAAKSGLVSLYLFLGAYGLYLAIVKKKMAGIAVLVAIPVIVMLALRFMPTFRERANYIDFTYQRLKAGDKTGNVGDIARLLSYKLAFQVISEHPLAGVGTGDMKGEMDKRYAAQYPEIAEYGRLLPHNQFLIVAIGCGIPAMLLFGVWVFMPLFQLRKNRQGFFFFIVWFILFIQLLIEPVLEVQFGVFVYLFFLLLQLQEVKDEREGNIARLAA